MAVAWWHARSLRSFAHRRPAHRRRAHGALQLAHGARLGRRLVLRIEDTDRERSTPENVEQILDALRWLELDWDEGPDFQTSHADRHAEVLTELLERGRPTAPTPPPTTSRPTRRSTAPTAASAASRGARAPSACACPTRATTVVHDVIRGDTTFAHVHLDDPVIARADGSVLYNFAVAVDDLDARDHPRRPRRGPPLQHAQAAAGVEAMGAEPPLYAHMPLLHGPDGKKLSKRHGAASVQELRDGRLPARGGAQLPRAARLGLRRRRDHPRHRAAHRALRPRRASRRTPPLRRAEAALAERPLHPRAVRRASSRAARAYTGRSGLRDAVAISREKMQTLADFWPLAGFIFDGPADDPAAREKWLADGRRRGAARRARRAGRRRAVRRRGDRARAAAASSSGGAASRARSSSRCASRSRARRCRPGSSRRSRSWAATRRCGGSTRRWLESAAQRQERSPDGRVTCP